MSVHNSRQRITARIGEDVLDKNGDKIGSIAEFYVINEADNFLWASIETGFLGLGNLGVIPLISVEEVGNALKIPYEKEKLKAAPVLDEDESMTSQKEEQLYQYYDIYPFELVDYEDNAKNNDPFQNEGKKEITLSEEQLYVDKQIEEGNVIHLHKYVVKDEVTLIIPIEREEAP